MTEGLWMLQLQYNGGALLEGFNRCGYGSSECRHIACGAVVKVGVARTAKVVLLEQGCVATLRHRSDVMKL